MAANSRKSSAQAFRHFYTNAIEEYKGLGITKRKDISRGGGGGDILAPPPLRPSSFLVFQRAVALTAPFDPGVLEPSFTRLLDFLMHVTVMLRAARTLLFSSVVHWFVGLT